MPATLIGAKQLIVNADDFGLSSGVNRAVAEAYRDGILTSATLLANAPGFDEAVEIASNLPGLGVGVHLNLVRGQPLSPSGQVSTLVGWNGVFMPSRLRKMTTRFLTDAETEYRRQVERVFASGIVPTHIDFEKHHAWQGKLYRLACRIASDYGIKAVRTLAEPVWWSLKTVGWPDCRRLFQAAALRTGFQLSVGKSIPLSSPDFLLGQLHIGGMDENAWTRLAANLPSGLFEAMVHPGHVESAGPVGEMGESWMTTARQVELAALLSIKVKQALRRAGVELVNYSVLNR